jgi:hypothetical protein
MQGVIGAIVLALFVAFMEVRSRRNGHAQRREALKTEVERVRNRHDQSVELKKFAGDMASIVQARVKW